MKILALDISTNSGYAVLEKTDEEIPNLLAMGNAAKTAKWLDMGPYPFCYIQGAEEIALKLIELVVEHRPDVVVVEETNSSSKSRYSQKALEFIHCMFLAAMKDLANRPPEGYRPPEVVYVSTSHWRKITGVELTKEDKKNNAKLNKAKAKAVKSGTTVDKKALGVKGKINKKHAAIRRANEVFALNLKVKDNDIADALMLGWAYCLGVRICDGK